MVTKSQEQIRVRDQATGKYSRQFAEPLCPKTYSAKLPYPIADYLETLSGRERAELIRTAIAKEVAARKEREGELQGAA